jgi:transcriptional regulator with PAS, ATPase and Fis domain
MVFDWSGNIRELKNVLERALILQQRSPDIRPSELLCTFNSSSPPLSAPIPASVQIGSLSLHEIEIDYLRSVLVQFSGNYTRTANALGISLSTLKRKIKKYGIK